MLEYFKRLFEYEFWATQKVLDSLEGIDPKANTKLFKVTSHLILANQLWLGRLLRKPNIDMASSIDLSECRLIAGQIEDEWKNYLGSLTEPRFNEKVAYVNLEGKAYETVLSDILAHVVNHGSYHRGQVASLVKQAGGTSASTDFIGFVRQQTTR